MLKSSKLHALVGPAEYPTLDLDRSGNAFLLEDRLGASPRSRAVYLFRDAYALLVQDTCPDTDELLGDVERAVNGYFELSFRETIPVGGH